MLMLKMSLIVKALQSPDIVILILALIGAGYAYYYFKIKKPLEDGRRKEREESGSSGPGVPDKGATEGPRAEDEGTKPEIVQ